MNLFELKKKCFEFFTITSYLSTLIRVNGNIEIATKLLLAKPLTWHNESFLNQGILLTAANIKLRLTHYSASTTARSTIQQLTEDFWRMVLLQKVIHTIRLPQNPTVIIIDRIMLMSILCQGLYKCITGESMINWVLTLGTLSYLRTTVFLTADFSPLTLREITW